MTVTNYTLLKPVFVDYFFSPMRRVYLVSNSQFEEIKPNQIEEEPEASRIPSKAWKRIINLKVNY